MTTRDDLWNRAREAWIAYAASDDEFVRLEKEHDRAKGLKRVVTAFRVWRAEKRQNVAEDAYWDAVKEYSAFLSQGEELPK